MRVVQPAAVRTWPAAVARTTGRAARLERLGLLATSLVLLLGLWLAYTGQTADAPPVCDAPAAAAPVPRETRAARDPGADPTTSDPRSLQAGAPPAGSSAADASPAPCALNLASLRSGQQLIPVLTMFQEPSDRRAVAAALFERVAPDTRHPALEHVGGLSDVTLPVDRVRRDRRLVALNARASAHPAATTVTVLSSSDLAALKPKVVVRTLDQYRQQVILLVALFMMAFWLAHLVRWWRGTTGDAVLLPLVQLLSGLGLMVMLAMRDPLRDMVIASSMTGGIAAGCLLFVVVSFIDFEDPRFRRAVLPPLGAAVVLATALLVFGGGPTGSGAKVNLLGVQPVEAIRLLVVFGLAAYFARRWLFLREFSQDLGSAPSMRTRRIRLPRWKDVRPLALTIATLLLFFFLQKDLGPALVMSCLFLGLYGVSRGRMALVLGGFAVLVFGFAAGYALGVPETVTRRVTMWLDPWDNGLAGGDQIAHALWALSSGGAWGLGPGVGDPQLIPAGHTDLVIAAIGEELGSIGVISVLAAFALLTWRTLRIGLRAPGDYTFFLVTGLTLGLALQAIIIIGGTMGLLPLSGVVTPFLSYGRSAMLSNFAAVAICAAVARRAGKARESFVLPVRMLGATLAVALGAVTLRAGMVEVADPDRVASRAALTQQADGGRRYLYNPRLAAAARQLVRGTIYDRNGLVLATNDPDQVAQHAARYAALGLPASCPEPQGDRCYPLGDDPDQVAQHAARYAALGLPASCPEPQGDRCYPLGGLAFHVLGNSDNQINWAAPNTSFAEQDFDATLKGFNDRPRIVRVAHPPTGADLVAVRRDYSELLPLVRHKGNPTHPDVVALMMRDRDLQLTIDAGLQVMVARALRARTLAAGASRGAAVVVDPATGELLASASYPWPDGRELSGAVPAAPERLLDRARYGLYPPGSTFKLVTAVAALRSQGEERETTFECVRLNDGRVGGRVTATGAVIRDDLEDRTPHGVVNLDRALVVSCNAYFGRLAQQLGSKALAEAAAAAQISVAAPPVEANLRRSLAHAGYGQGEVVASPLRMARAAGALGVDGLLRDVRVTALASSEPVNDVRWVSEAGAARLRRDMREVVLSGTGRALAGHAVPIAGKTGTAEIDGARSHAWFVGFAPFSQSPARIAFAVIVENGGYGGRIAAPLAGDIVTAAQSRGLLK